MTSTTQARDPGAVRRAIAADRIRAVAAMPARFARRIGAGAAKIRRSGQLGVIRETEIGRLTGGRV
jgi:hypothetical protein